MRYIQNHRRWVPGGWCNFEDLACTKYYSFFGKYLLNSNYTILPIAEAIRQCESLFDLFGVNGEIFVRPDAVDKSFSGRLVAEDMFDAREKRIKVVNGSDGKAKEVEVPVRRLYHRYDAQGRPAKPIVFCSPPGKRAEELFGKEGSTYLRKDPFGGR